MKGFATSVFIMAQITVNVPFGGSLQQMETPAPGRPGPRHRAHGLGTRAPVSAGLLVRSAPVFGPLM